MAPGDIELTQDYLGGVARAGDCGYIDSANSDGSVNVVLTRRECDPLQPPLPIPFVLRDHLRDCRCDDDD